jgi:glycosyltransferase involved in cell wall biosynthesis
MGGLGTTATLLGLRRFLDAVWPSIRARLPDVQLWVVGDTSSVNGDVLAQLDDANAVVTGFVQDLSAVLRPGDLHVIPWEHGTGVRTRVLNCFRHGQALVAVHAGVEGFQNLQAGTHCVLVNNAEDLMEPLISLALDGEERRRIALGGQSYLREELTVDAVLPRFSAIVDRLLLDRSSGHGEV